MTGLEIYLIFAVIIMCICVLTLLWRAGGTVKEPTSRIRESYEPYGYPKYMRMVYIPEGKGRFGRWSKVAQVAISEDSAEYNLRMFVMEKLKVEEQRKITHYDSLCNRIE